MKSLILATAAVLALGVGGAGAATMSGHQGTAMAPHTMRASTSRSVTSAAHHSLTVKEAQRALRRHGLYHGNIDGIIGPRTRHALARYQRMQRLPVTASLNHRTLEALMGSRTVGVGSSMHRHAVTGQGTMGQMPPATPSQTGTSSQTTGTGTAPPSTMNTGVGTNTGTTK